MYFCDIDFNIQLPLYDTKYITIKVGTSLQNEGNNMSSQETLAMVGHINTIDSRYFKAY